MPTPIRPNVLRMAPYSPGKPIDEVKRELGLSHVVKLASNENPLGPSPKAVQAIQAAAQNLHLYPDAATFDLRAALSEHYRIGPEHLMVGNGSDELIHLLGLIYLSGPADAMVVGDPSFVRYDAAAYLSDSRLIKVALDATYTHDLDAMAAAITPETRLVWIANPNNPTGTVITKTGFDRFLSRIPAHVTVVLDEAYYEYAEGLDDLPNSLDYVRAGAPVIGLRTFSKAYGLAGIRLGYGFASAEIADAIHRAREPFNVNSLAQIGGIAALRDREYLGESIAANTRGRAQIEAAFREVGATPVPGYANFVLAEMGTEAKPIFEALLREGVIVRSGHVLGLPTTLRVSIGTEIENETFARALVKVMGSKVTA